MRLKPFNVLHLWSVMSLRHDRVRGFRYEKQGFLGGLAQLVEAKPVAPFSVALMYTPWRVAK